MGETAPPQSFWSHCEKADLTLLQRENPSSWVCGMRWMGGYREEQKPQSGASSVYRAIKRPAGLGQWGSRWEILPFVGPNAMCPPWARCSVHRNRQEVLSALRGLASRGKVNVGSYNTQF